MTVKTKIVQIGNSRGVRIPKGLLDATGLRDEVELAAEGGCLTIRPARPPRADWEEQFARGAAGDPGLVDGNLTGQSSWDQDEWQW
jgi:antitoxin MazE